MMKKDLADLPQALPAAKKSQNFNLCQNHSRFQNVLSSIKIERLKTNDWVLSHLLMFEKYIDFFYRQCLSCYSSFFTITFFHGNTSHWSQNDHTLDYHGLLKKCWKQENERQVKISEITQMFFWHLPDRCCTVVRQGNIHHSGLKLKKTGYWAKVKGILRWSRKWH